MGEGAVKTYEKENFRKDEEQKEGKISKKEEKIRRGRQELIKREYTEKGIDMEYELCLKVECIDVNCKLNTHLAIESQLERENIFIPFLQFRI